MEKKKSLNFIIVVILILSLTMYDLIVIGKATISYANELINGKVQITSYFKDEQGNRITNIEETTSKEIFLYHTVSVNDGGYFAGGNINLENSNFIFDNSYLDENVSKIEENTITLKQINGGESKEIKSKIKILKNNIYDLNMLAKETEIKLNGVFTTDKEEQVEAKTSVQIKFANPYSNETEVFTSKVLANKVYSINGENKRIVQFEIKNKLDGTNYPIKGTNFEISVPENVEDVKVYSRGTEMTNGKSANEFQEACYNHSIENKLLTIHYENPIATNENGENLVYWTQDTNDRLLVTYVFNESAQIENNITAKSNITMYDDMIGDRESSIIHNENSIDVSEEVNNIISGRVKCSEKEIYKGKIYSGEDRNITTLTNIDIQYVGIENETILEKKENKFLKYKLNNETNENEVVKELDAKVKYKDFKISKDVVDNILGQTGKIIIKSENTELIKIDKALVESLKELNTNEQQEKKSIDFKECSVQMQNDKIIVEYNKEKDNLSFIIHSPEKQGSINMYHTQVIKNNNLERADLKQVDTYQEKWEIKEGLQTPSKTLKNKIGLKETTTLSQIDIEKNSLVAGKKYEVIEMRVSLINNNEKYDLFNEPIIEITVPKDVSEIEIKDVQIIYADGLQEKNRSIVQNSDGTKTIKIELKNSQTTHQENIEGVVGTDVKIICNMLLDKDTSINSGEVTLNVINKEDVVYESSDLQKATLTYIVANPEQTGTGSNQNGETGTGTGSNQSGETGTGTGSNQNGGTSTGNGSNQNGETGTGANQNGGTGSNQNGNTSSEATQDNKLTITKKVSTGANENADNTDVHEREILKYTITVKNNTNEEIKNATVTDNIPNEVTLVEYDNTWGMTNGYNELEERKFEKEIPILKENETLQYEYYVRVKKNSEYIGKFIGGDGISTEAVAKISGISTEYKSNKTKNKIMEGLLEVNLVWTLNKENLLFEDEEYDGYLIKVKNIAEEDITNINVKSYVPNGLEYLNAYELQKGIYKEDGNFKDEEDDDEANPAPDLVIFEKPTDDTNKLNSSCYNSKNNEFNYTFDKISKGDERAILIRVKTNKLGEGTYEKIIKNKVEATFEHNNSQLKYVSNQLKISIVKENVSVVLDTSLNDTYIDEEKEFFYKITVTNLGPIEVEYTLKDILPDGVLAESIQHKLNGDGEVSSDFEINGSNIISNTVNLNKGASIEVLIKVKATNIAEDNLKELEIENKATFGKYESNTVKNIIINKNYIEGDLAEGNYFKDEEIKESSSGEYKENGETIKKNSISGKVWFDANKDGMINNNEKYISNISVQLIKKSTGKTINKTITDEKGKYEFTNVNNGEYIIGFEFDSEIYEPTTYQKNKVSKDRNSDVILAKDISDNMKLGLTDIITIKNNGAIDIDLGLIKETKYNIKIQKYIDAIIVKNSSETKKYDFKTSSLAKIEIPGKQTDNSTVFVTYKFVIENNGELAGYASEIIDYLPKDMKFDSNINAEWNRQGENVVCESLKDTIINVGETKEVTLVLSKKMNNSNTGITVNTAEITKTKNELGTKDIIDSDNKSSASLIISIKTGNTIEIIFAILTLSIITIGIGIVIIKRKVL